MDFMEHSQLARQRSPSRSVDAVQRAGFHNRQGGGGTLD
jgi:hypothetical protein